MKAAASRCALAYGTHFMIISRRVISAPQLAPAETAAAFASEWYFTAIIYAAIREEARV